MQPEKTGREKHCHFVLHTRGILPVAIISKAHINIRGNGLVFHHADSKNKVVPKVSRYQAFAQSSVGNREAESSFTSTSCY